MLAPPVRICDHFVRASVRRLAGAVACSNLSKDKVWPFLYSRAAPIVKSSTCFFMARSANSVLRALRSGYFLTAGAACICGPYVSITFLIAASTCFFTGSGEVRGRVPSPRLAAPGVRGSTLAEVSTVIRTFFDRRVNRKWLDGVEQICRELGFYRWIGEPRADIF